MNVNAIMNAMMNVKVDTTMNVDAMVNVMMHEC